jgi:two-component sensor histidine kinase
MSASANRHQLESLVVFNRNRWSPSPGALKQAETQQQVLLKELNHRVKNNMQMLQILLEDGARRAKSAEALEVLEEASGRIIAIAAAQRVLYRTTDAIRCARFSQHGM